VADPDKNEEDGGKKHQRCHAFFALVSFGFSPGSRRSRLGRGRPRPAGDAERGSIRELASTISAKHGV